MGWKDWPYWLRGSIIGLAINFTGIGVMFGTIICYVFIKLIGVKSYDEDPTILLYGALLNILLGAIFGWMFGKGQEMKNKRLRINK